MSFLSKGGLERHRRVHMGQKSFECHNCEKSFYDNGSLVRHKRSHKQDRLYPCLVCRKRFNIKSNCARHLILHKEAKPFQCLECKKQFSRNGHFLKHVGKKPHECPVCGNTFCERGKMVRHQNQHSDNMREKFLCPECGKTFNKKSNMRSHQKSHTAERPLSAMTVGKSSKTSGTLELIETATGERSSTNASSVGRSLAPKQSCINITGFTLGRNPMLALSVVSTSKETMIGIKESMLDKTRWP
ncbi:oocyte zinc finger protein XlCOF26-like [Rhineura floridana]|uniref:oocyte zinc finger protein XlCOF26-like n=1 Tax=Rhineura floridana TaxID=261503 RepID=UPI002AC8343A|nr:oocyte zinc finger protein XlCOF26-like [Rhineura floridana]